VIECFIYFSSNDNSKEDSEEEGNTKRPHVSTGNTPHKPKDKCERFNVAAQCRRGKKLTYPRSPAKIVEYHAFPQ